MAGTEGVRWSDSRMNVFRSTDGNHPQILHNSYDNAIMLY